MNKCKLPILLFWALLLLSSVKLHAQIVAVVNSKNPIDSLSLIKLRHIYQGEITNWESNMEGGAEIILLDHKLKTKTADQFYKKVVGLSHSRMRLVWIGKLLNGELQSLPVKLASEADILRYIPENPGAIGFVSVANFDSTISSIKAIKIEGKDFKNEAYPLQ